MLNENSVAFDYREYKKHPLSLEELQTLLSQLNQPANTLLRKREKAYRELGLTGAESDDKLLPLFVQHPSLMQRPIFVHNEQAVLCRPHDKLLELL